MIEQLKELRNYPSTIGKRAAMKHFKWNRLTKVEEMMYADQVLELAKLIDEEAENG